MIKRIVAFLCFLLPTRPTRLLYRLSGHRIGKNVRMPMLSFVKADDMSIGNDVVIRRFVFIDVKTLSLGANTIVSYWTQIKGETDFRCGDNCFFGIHCLIHCAEPVTFGFYSGLGPRCTVYTHGSFLPATLGYPAKFAPVVAEDFVWIAMEVVLMPGAYIERNCIVNPGVVVQRRVKSNSILQTDPHRQCVFDLARLQKLSRKDLPYWHDRIISGFLRSLCVQFRREGDPVRYQVVGRFEFVSRPEENSIELCVGNETVRYDLNGFYADEGKSAVHRKFLAFLRLRFGLTLRTKYR